MLGTAITLTGPDTYWIGDALNHNCIIRAMRIANVPGEPPHHLRPQRRRGPRAALAEVPAEVGCVVVIFDGIFSMRGDPAPLAGILRRARRTPLLP